MRSIRNYAGVFALAVIGSGCPNPYHQVGAIELKLPKAWNIERNMLDDANYPGIVLDNFDEKYVHGGLLPKEGATITISESKQTPFGSEPGEIMLDAVIDNYFKREIHQEAEDIRVAGCDAKKVITKADFLPYAEYKHTVIFTSIRHNGSMRFYKFVMEHNTNDSEAVQESFARELDGIINSAKFTDPSATKCAGSE